MIKIDCEKECSEIWVIFRNGIVINSCNTRKEAVVYVKELLKQSLKDLENQDKNDDEYDYDIDLKNIEVKFCKKRETYLGL